MQLEAEGAARMILQEEKRAAEDGLGSQPQCFRIDSTNLPQIDWYMYKTNREMFWMLSTPIKGLKRKTRKSYSPVVRCCDPISPQAPKLTMSFGPSSADRRCKAVLAWPQSTNYSSLLPLARTDKHTFGSPHLIVKRRWPP